MTPSAWSLARRPACHTRSLSWESVLSTPHICLSSFFNWPFQGCISVVTYSQGINESANFRFLQRLPSYLASAETVRDLLLPAETTVHDKWLPADCPCDSASCRESRQEAKSHGQSLQEAIYQAQQSRQEARDRGQSRRKPNITYSLCRKRKLSDSFIPCVTIAVIVCPLSINLKLFVYFVQSKSQYLKFKVHFKLRISQSEFWYQ